MAWPYDKASQQSERGAALLLVTFILIVVLVGGLAAVAITTGELNSSRGFRTREAALACGGAALQNIRSQMPTWAASSDWTSANAWSDTLQVAAGGTSLTTKSGHYSGTMTSIAPIDSKSFDASALFSGANIANKLAGSGGGMQVIRATAICVDTSIMPAYPTREVETIFRYGIPMP